MDVVTDINMYRWLLASLVTITLLGGLAWGLDRWRHRLPMGGGKGARRLRITESLFLDARNRLIIVKVDEAEHVLLLGATGNLQLKKSKDKESRKK